MALAVGRRLGLYEITTAIGAGGMGEVYRARDTKLNRDVALKVLPDAFALDPDRLARFKREAQLLASLNHPHIAAIYGFEDSGDVHALVLELVEGPTLADRIAQGPVPLDEAIPIARQVADALEAAHAQGIVHRDLKPANIKLRPDGTVKVLDFGLAKAVDATAGARLQADVSVSPTITSPAMTQLGVILGTAAYMSPEQAKGQAADKRSDIWAFGCVLYEMLTARRAFAGGDVSDTLAAVLRAEPDWAALPSDVPASIRALLQGCLTKDRRERIGDVSTALFLLKDPFGAMPVVTAIGARRRWPVALAFVATAAVFTLVGLIAAWSGRRPSPAPITRFSIHLPDGERFGNGQNVVAISPDGKRIAYSAMNAATVGGFRPSYRLLVRSMAEMEPRLLMSGYTVAPYQTFSPDGQWVGFWSNDDGAIKKISVNGGSPLTICKAERALDLTWDRDAILFVHPDKGIMRVSPDGGEPEILAGVKPTEAVAAPQLIDGGRALLFTLTTETGSDRWDKASVVVQSLKDGQRKVVLRGGADARYVPTGHLVFAVGSTLLAVPFDEKRGQARGSPTPILEGVRRTGFSNAAAKAQFAVSSDGTLVYVPGTAPSSNNQRTLVLVDRTGSEHPLPLPPRPYLHPRISPNGRQLAIGTDDGKEAVVWVIDDLKGSSSPRKLTFEGRNLYPIWTPDGQSIVFQSDREGDRGLFWQRADGTRPAERLTKSEQGDAHVPGSWTPDGKTLAFHVSRPPKPSAIWVLMLNGDRTPRAFVESHAPSAYNAVFSPDGRWLAYSETLTAGGPPNLFLQPFPATGAKYQLTTNVGTGAAWSPDGKQIFYETGPSTSNRIFVLDVRTPPVTASQAGFIEFNARTEQTPAYRAYDITPDGKQFVIAATAQTDPNAQLATQVNVILNWLEELRQRVPAK
jgi:serine/threonine protein kinase/Tol biopolymer transport system component